MTKLRLYIYQHWKLIINILTLIAVIIAIYFTRHDFYETFDNLLKVHAWFLLLIIPLELLNYHAQTKLYQKLFTLVGNKLSYKFLYLASLELNFVNHVFPSGGAAGISYFGLRFKDEDITGGKATFIQVMKLALTFASFEILIILSLVLLSLVGKVNNFIILISTFMTTLLVVGTILFIYIISKKERINNFFLFITFQINNLLKLLHFKKGRDVINIVRAKKTFEDFHLTFVDIRREYKQIYSPFLYALLANFTEILVVYVVFLAFGQTINFGGVILAYGIANFAGLVSILPGGIGIYEALMTATLVAVGVPVRISFPAIIMYRVLNTLLQLPPGYYLYHRNLND